MSMNSPNQLSPQHQIYADLMDEARIRIHALHDALLAKDTWVPRLFEEFAFLQIRMLCESVALGCLIAHGDVKTKKSLKKWRVPDLMKEMEKFGSDFFPRGVRFRSVEGVLNFDEYNAPQITKTELIKLWEMSGNKLHRGTAERILSENGKQIIVDIGKIENWGMKIKNLLEQHIISSADNESHLLVALASEDSGGKCCIWLAENPFTPNIS